MNNLLCGNTVVHQIQILHPLHCFFSMDRILTLLDDMVETMYAAEGVGLAAPQVGVLRRVIVVDVGEEGGGLYEAINPQLISASGEQDGPEGCLSVPGVWGYVTRPDWVKVKAQDRNGNWFEAEGTGLTARCFCHELDHLDGHLYSELCDELDTNDDLDRMMEEEEQEGEE